jgi:hypothetical protein
VAALARSSNAIFLSLSIQMRAKAVSKCFTIDSEHVCRISPNPFQRVNATPTSTASSASRPFSLSSKFLFSSLVTKGWLYAFKTSNSACDALGRLSPGSDPLHRRTQGAQDGGAGRGLAKVGIRPEVERQLLIVQRAVNRCVADKRDVSPASILADLPAKPVTVQIGHKQVGNDGIDRMALQEHERFVAVRSNDYRMTFGFQHCAQEFATGVVVVCDQNIHKSACEKQLPP